MTTREFLTAVSVCTALSEDTRNKATEMIAALDKRNAQRAAKPSKTAIANEPIKAEIMAFLADHNDALASDISAALDGVSTNKVSALCRQLCESGAIEVKTVKVPKRGKLCAYNIVRAD